MPVANIAAIIDGNFEASLVIDELHKIGTYLFTFIAYTSPTGRMQEMNAPALLLHFDVLHLLWKSAGRGGFARELNNPTHIKLDSAKGVQSWSESGQVISRAAMPGV